MTRRACAHRSSANFSRAGSSFHSSASVPVRECAERAVPRTRDKSNSRAFGWIPNANPPKMAMYGCYHQPPAHGAVGESVRLSSCSWTCYSDTAAPLELLAAAARAVIVAADLRRQARLGFRLHLGAHELTKIGEVFRLIRLHTHNHFPATFLSNANDLLRLLYRSHADHSRPFMSS